jgi:hypothetical protein
LARERGLRVPRSEADLSRLEAHDIAVVKKSCPLKSLHEFFDQVGG